MLRIRAGAPFQKATVPLLLTARGALTDSWDIALWSAAQAPSGRSLLPEDMEEAILEWEDLAEEVMQLGRARVTRALVRTPEASRESVPGVLRHLGPFTTLLGNVGSRYIASKYGVDVAERDAEASERVCALLEEVRGALYPNGTLLGARTYADISVATALQFVMPVADALIPLGENSRPLWHWPEVAGQYPDLLAWRDAVFAERAF